MGFWLTAGLIAALIAAALVAAALRAKGRSAPTAAYDLRVYRDQLREVERDLARGVLTEAEAARTRTEVARRVLEADRALAASEAARTTPTGRVAIIAAVVLTVGGAFALYLTLGAPGYPDLPLDTRIALVERARADRPSQAEAEAEIPSEPREHVEPRRAELVAQLRLAMERNPDEVEGLGLLAHEEARLGNFRAARFAQSRRVELLGEEAEAIDYLDLAEMQFMAAGGYISPETEALLQRVLEMDRGNGAARYYVGLMFAQQGRPDLGYPVWRELLADSMPGDPWLDAIRGRIELVAALAGDPVALEDLPQPPALPASGPTAADFEAAEALSPEDRAAMIESMVNGLAERLANEGGPPEDWARLISSYVALGQHSAARSVRDEALVVFARSDEALALIREAATGLETNP